MFRTTLCKSTIFLKHPRLSVYSFFRIRFFWVSLSLSLLTSLPPLLKPFIPGVDVGGTGEGGRAGRKKSDKAVPVRNSPIASIVKKSRLTRAINSGNLVTSFSEVFIFLIDLAQCLPDRERGRGAELKLVLWQKAKIHVTRRETLMSSGSL